MRNVLIILCLFVICATSAAKQEGYSENGTSSSMALEVPGLVHPGQIMAIMGSGAVPGDTIVLSITSTVTVPIVITAGVPMYHLDINKMHVFHDDVLSVQAEPVEDAFAGYKHLNHWWDPEDIHKYPAYFLMDTQHGEVYWTTPYWGAYDVDVDRENIDYSGGEHPSTEIGPIRGGEWLNVVFGGRSSASSVNLKLTIKRLVKANRNGSFSTRVYVPLSKVLGKNYTINAMGTDKKASAMFQVDISQVDNELPTAFIYTPTYKPVDIVAPQEHHVEFEMAPVAKLGESITLDGRYSADNDGNIVSYLWDFGDGQTADGAVVQHSYLRKGRFNATLNVTDDRGATDSMMVPVAVS